MKSRRVGLGSLMSPSGFSSLDIVYMSFHRKVTCFTSQASTASFFGPHIFSNREAGTKGCARDWDQGPPSAWNREEMNPGTQSLFLATLPFCIWGKYGSSGKCRHCCPGIWRQTLSHLEGQTCWEGSSLPGLPCVCSWATPHAKEKECENRLENQETWIPAPVPSVFINTTIGKPQWRTKRDTSENSL